MKFKAVIVGAGRIASFHLDVLKEMRELEIVSISNTGHPRIKELAQKYSIPRTYNNYQEMYFKEKPDVAYILVSPSVIEEVSSFYLQNRVNCFIEKPAGERYSAALNLATIAEQNDCINMVGLNRRFYSNIMKARDEVIKRGHLFSIHVEGSERIKKMREDGRHSEKLLENLLFNNSVHCLDLMRYCAGGDDVDKQLCVNKSFKESNGDNLTGLFKFRNGIVGTYVSHWHTPGGWALEMFGEGIRVSARPLENCLIKTFDNQDWTLSLDEVDQKYKPGFFKQHDYFIKSLKEGKKISYPAADLYDFAKTAKIAEDFVKVVEVCS